MRKIWLIPAFCFIFFLFSGAEEKTPLIKVESSIKPERLSRAQEGKVVFKFLIEKGITISSQPSFTIEFSPCEALLFPKNFFAASDLNIESSEEMGHEYLNLREPIEIPFTVNIDAKRGRHTLQGKIKYFAFSLEDGWCLKISSKFSASFYTRQSIIKKSEKH